MRATVAIGTALLVLGAALVTVGLSVASPSPARFLPSDSSCPPSAPTSSGYAPRPVSWVYTHQLQGLVPGPPLGIALAPAGGPEGTDYNFSATANVTVSTGDLIAVTATAVNFGAGAGDGPNGSGAPVLAISDSFGSFYWVGQLSDHVHLPNGDLYESPPGNFGAHENLTWETWFGSAGGSGKDGVTVTLENPAPVGTGINPPAEFTTPDVVAFAFPAGDGAYAAPWVDFWNPTQLPYQNYLTSNITPPVCVDLLAVGYVADGFPGAYNAVYTAPTYGEDHNYTPSDSVNGAPLGFSEIVDGYAGAGSYGRMEWGPVSSAESFEAWNTWLPSSAAPRYIQANTLGSAIEDGLELIEASPYLAANGLGEDGGCPTATFQWTNPAPPFGQSIVNVTVYLYTGSGTLVRAISTGGPATQVQVGGLICGASYWFQVQPWFSSGLAGPLSGALSFVAGQVAGSFSGSSAAGFLGLTPVDWAAVAALVVAASVVVFALTRGHHRRGHEVGAHRER